jgi:Cys-tRNA(Pro)/Cys-tRNA(Cys) deacylase
VKTNAMRLLEREGVRFEVREYEVDESDLAAERVAAQIGLAPEWVFKTIITIGDATGPIFALAPAGTHVVPRLLAAASGNKRVEVAPLRDVLALTGYVRGAVTALGAKRAYPVYIDETAELWPFVSISAGVRGRQILIAPTDLVRVTTATLADIARPS